MKNNNKLDFGFYIIPIFLIINLFVRWEITNTITNDTLNYIQLAKVLSNSDNTHFFSLFPIGYPILLAIIDFFIDNYIISYKVGAFLCLSFSLTFVKINDFYWREIWTLLSFHTFLSLTPMAWSETLMIPLLIIIFYYNYHFINDNISSKKILLFYPILLSSCVLVKYSSLFYIIAHFAFTLFLKFIQNEKYKTYLKITIISSILSIVYLIINYILTGFFTGKRLPANEEQIANTFRFFQIIYNLNPFIGLSSNLGNITNIIFSTPFFIFFLGIILKYIKISKIKSNNNSLFIFNLLNSLFFLLGTLYSYFNTRIDPLDYRLLLGYYIFFFFSIICALSQFQYKNIVLLFLGLSTSISFILFSLKQSSFFFIPC